MLMLLAVTFAATLICAAIIQLMVSLVFYRRIRRKQVIRVPRKKQRGVAVLLCIRGCDPSIRNSLIGILNQDFVDYKVHLVVDHPSDAAWDVVQEIKREHDVNDLIRIHEMRQPLETCGLKCSALLQGVAGTADDTKYLVLMDADVRPHETWLSELIGPLVKDKSIGIVTGNQWFEPPAGSTWGSLIRSMWNAGALVPTAIFQNPWAGTLAMRMQDFRDSEMARVWRHSVVDDGPMRSVMESIGKSIHFAPSLIMVNREKCTLSFVNRWVTRMLTWSRLYESTFFLSVLHSIFSNTVMLGTMVLLAVAIATGQWTALALTVVALVFAGLMTITSYFIVRSIVARSCMLRGETIQPMSVIRIFKLLLTVVSAHIIYGWSCMRAVFSQHVQWREITYELKSKNEVKMINYQPIAQTADEISKVSI